MVRPKTNKDETENSVKYGDVGNSIGFLPTSGFESLSCNVYSVCCGSVGRKSLTIYPTQEEKPRHRQKHRWVEYHLEAIFDNVVRGVDVNVLEVITQFKYLREVLFAFTQRQRRCTGVWVRKDEDP